VGLLGVVGGDGPATNLGEPKPDRPLSVDDDQEEGNGNLVSPLFARGVKMSPNPTVLDLLFLDSSSSSSSLFPTQTSLCVCVRRLSPRLRRPVIRASRVESTD
jgi:hypothetical protein